MEKLLTIAIPTYNRLEFLKKNINELVTIIGNLHVEDQINIYISDNCSEDGTGSYLIEEKIDYLDYKINEENIGGINNIISLFNNVNTKYIMLLGDDDYLTEEYVKNVLECIKEKDVSCIIPSYINVDLDGNITGRGRDVDVPSKLWEPGFNSCLNNTWRGHQLSGLVFKNEGLWKRLKENDIKNMYLQMFLVGCCCIEGRTYQLTDYPIRVTRPPQKIKTWGYGNDGLICDVFANFIKLDINDAQKVKMQQQFLVNQYWRYAMYIKKGVKSFVMCILNVVRSSNTMKMTKIWFIFSCIPILFVQAIRLLFSGKLINTLSTKVDI